MLFIFLRINKEIDLPIIRGIPLPPERFGILAIFLSIGILSVANTFLNDALNGARYIKDRNSAQTVGSFPWYISRYSGKSFGKKILSLIIRSLMSFHFIIYVYFWHYYGRNIEIISPEIYAILILFLFGLSIWTFYLSQKFQRPILFDRKTEEERQSDLAKLTEAVEEQIKSLRELIDLFKQRRDTEMKK